jgi:serine/threonine protein kinase
MAIEKINYKIHKEEEVTQEMLHTENVRDHLCALAEQFFNKDLEVGSGNYSNVYSDRQAGLVYKKEKLLKKPKNDVHTEATFLVQLSGMSTDVLVPEPVVSFVADLKREKDDKQVRQSVLVMEEIDGYSIDRMLTINPESGLRVPFPKTFNADTFFPALRSFIKKMHTEKGIYHRDIADRNIMIDNESGNPVLIDFGDAVEFFEEFVEEGETDAYGRIVRKDVNGEILPRPDLDLERLDQLEVEVRGFLTKK